MNSPLFQALADLTAPMTTQQRHQRLIEGIRGAMPQADGVLIATIEDGVMETKAAGGIAPEHMMSVPVQEVEGWSALAESPVPARAEGLPGDPKFFADSTGVADQFPRAVVAVPMRVKGVAVGVLVLVAAQHGAFDEIPDDVFLACAALAAAGIRASELWDRKSALAKRRRAVAAQLLAQTSTEPEALVGESSAVQLLRARIDEIKDGGGIVFLMGEPGVGKRTVARALHQRSQRASHAFVLIDPALQSQPMVGSSWSAIDTGTTDGSGPMPLIEAAASGTLYFPDPDQLPSATQDALAALIKRSQSLDARIVVSSTIDPMSDTGRSHYTPALANLLSGSLLRVPALRERLEDLPEIVGGVLRRLGSRLAQVPLPEATLQALEDYDWPGNLRELERVIEDAVEKSPSTGLVIDGTSLSPPHDLGRYKLQQRIGMGAMGEVWLGHHEQLGRDVAVKLVRSDVGPTDSDKARERFLREVEATAALRCLHTVDVYDFGVSTDGALYYVMERLDGLDVKDAVARSGPMPQERVVEHLKQACLSLGEAHDAGLVHRDVKPSNLFITRLGCAVDIIKVLDFGLVKPAAAKPLTTVGMTHGTPAYMCPEAALARPTIDGRADLYSLACTAYFMLSGKPPFTGATSTDVLTAHVRQAPPLISELAHQPILESLEALLLQCLSKSPEDRPQSAWDVLATLEDIELDLPLWTEEQALAWWEAHVQGASR